MPKAHPHQDLQACACMKDLLRPRASECWTPGRPRRVRRTPWRRTTGSTLREAAGTGRGAERIGRSEEVEEAVEEVAEGVEREARDVDVGEEEGVEGEEDGNLKGNRATIKRKDIYFLGEVFK